MLNHMRRVTTILLASLALIAAGCGDDGEEPSAAPASGGSAKLADAITFELIGGDAFRDDTMTVEADGSATIKTRFGEERAQLTPDELSQLAAQAEVLADAESAVTRPPQPDMVSYHLIYRGKDVATDDPAMPDDLSPLVGTFIELLDRYGPS